MRRRLTWLAGLGCFGLAVVFAASWGEIRTRYHLHRLQHEPAYLHTLLGEPEDSVKGMALRRFVSTTPGADRLFESYIRLIDDGLSKRHKIGISAIPGKALLRLRAGACAIEWNPQAIPGSGGVSYQLTRSEARDAAALCLLLRHIDHRKFTHALYSGLRFTVLDKDAALPLYHGRPFSPEQTAALEDYMCIAEREAK